MSATAKLFTMVVPRVSNLFNSNRSKHVVLSRNILMPGVANIAGQQFGRLTVVGHAEGKYWRCECQCGGSITAQKSHLVHGGTRSCGCLKSQDKITHGLSSSSEYKSWDSAKQRCTNPNNSRFDRYGGRGITMCDRWMNSFASFYEDMGPRPSPRHTIERLDNDGNYEPGNCCWATVKEQTNNTSVQKRIRERGNKCKHGHDLTQTMSAHGLCRECTRMYNKNRRLK